MVIVGAMAGLGIVLAIVSFDLQGGYFCAGIWHWNILKHLSGSSDQFVFFLSLHFNWCRTWCSGHALCKRCDYYRNQCAWRSSGRNFYRSDRRSGTVSYGIGMAAGIALLGMLIQFAINKDHYDEEEDEEEPYEDTDKRIRKKNASNSQEYDSKYNREDLYKNPSDRRSEGRIRNTDSDEMYSRRNTGRNKEYSDRKNQQIFREEAAEEKKTVLRTTEEVREATLAPAEERHRKETVPGSKTKQHKPKLFF